MKRRNFINKAGVGVLATGGALLAPSMTQAKTQFKWKMVTAWPKNFPGLGVGANLLAQMINEMSGNRITVKVYGANELVPALQVFDAVSDGVAQIGHSGAYYWKGKHEATQFFASIPFGLTAQEMNAWLYYGGGMALWRELYAPFNLIPTAAGNTGVQMAGWFKREIKTVADLTGLKMRIPGLGGEVLRRMGAATVNIPGGELFTSLQSGVLDAAEWVGPYNDLAFGFHKVAKYYYYPGWHEPGSVIEAMLNKQAFNNLPADLQSIVLAACQAANINMLADYTAKNNQALDTLVNKHGVSLMALPNDVLLKLKQLAEEVTLELASKNPMAQKIYHSFNQFRAQVSPWSALSEQAFLKARTLG